MERKKELAYEAAHKWRNKVVIPTNIALLEVELKPELIPTERKLDFFEQLLAKRIEYLLEMRGRAIIKVCKGEADPILKECARRAGFYVYFFPSYYSTLVSLRSGVIES